MPKRSNEPNKLLMSSVVKLDDGGTVGILILDTDTGFIELGVNHTGAEILHQQLTAFLAGKSPKFDE